MPFRRPGRRRSCLRRLPQIRTCPIKAYGSSATDYATRRRNGPPAWANAAIRWSAVDTLGGYKAPGVFPSTGPMARHSLPSTGFRWLLFPCFHGTMKCSDLLPSFSPRFVLPSLGDTVPCACLRSRKPDAGLGPGVLRLVTPDQLCRHGDDRNSQVPGEPWCAYAVFSDPGGTEPPGYTVARHGPCELDNKGSPRVIASRGSIARPWHWLSTLRSCCYQPPRKTRFRLPARLYRVGLLTHRIPKKVSRHYLLSSFSRLRLAQRVCKTRRWFANSPVAVNVALLGTCVLRPASLQSLV